MAIPPKHEHCYFCCWIPTPRSSLGPISTFLHRFRPLASGALDEFPITKLNFWRAKITRLPHTRIPKIQLLTCCYSWELLVELSERCLVCFSLLPPWRVHLVAGMTFRVVWRDISAQCTTRHPMISCWTTYLQQLQQVTSATIVTLPPKCNRWLLGWCHWLADSGTLRRYPYTQ